MLRVIRPGWYCHCWSRSRVRVHTRERVVQPSIVITTVPEAAVGGSGKLGRIAGRVTGAGPGHQVVIYTKSGVWWCNR